MARRYNALVSPSGVDNTAIGNSSLGANTSRSENVAFGNGALNGNSSGVANVAIGYEALYANTTGQQNTAVGFSALQRASSSTNTAFGCASLLFMTSGYDNVAMGSRSGHAIVYGSGDVAIGSNALQNNQTGSFNTVIGENAGNNLLSGSNNIDIANIGSSNDNAVIRIGTSGTQTETFIAGVYGTTIGNGEAVLVNSSGKLGVQSSSIRYKRDVANIDGASDALMNLRPVQFRYKQTEANGANPLQFGLVAEEVAQVYPELVSRGADGVPDSVQYHRLPALLLNEIQKQHRSLE